MPGLKDERTYNEQGDDITEIELLSRMVRDARARADAEQAARERAQQALREIGDKCLVYLHVPSCPCNACIGLDAIAAIARKGLGEAS